MLRQFCQKKLKVWTFFNMATQFPPSHCSPQMQHTVWQICTAQRWRRNLDPKTNQRKFSLVSLRFLPSSCQGGRNTHHHWSFLFFCHFQKSGAKKTNICWILKLKKYCHPILSDRHLLFPKTRNKQCFRVGWRY